MNNADSSVAQHLAGRWQLDCGQAAKTSLWSQVLSATTAQCAKIANTYTETRGYGSVENTSENKSHRIMRLRAELCKPKSFDSQAAGKSFYAPATRNMNLKNFCNMAVSTTAVSVLVVGARVAPTATANAAAATAAAVNYDSQSLSSLSPVCIHFSLSKFNKNARKVSFR